MIGQIIPIYWPTNNDPPDEINYNGIILKHLNKEFTPEKALKKEIENIFSGNFSVKSF